MYKNALFAAWAVSLILVGCGKPRPAESFAESYSQDCAIPDVKYPAAIVFEGGKGDPDDAKHRANWRLYLCLDKAAKAKGEVELDFAALGNPLERKWTEGKTGAPLYTERLNKVTLSYQYSAQISGDEKQTDGFGKAEFKSTSKQEWEVTETAADYKPGKDRLDEDFFHLKLLSNSLVHFGKKSYQVGGEKFYLSNWLVRYAYSEKDKISKPIDVCEKASKAVVWQTGKELNP